MFCHQARRRRHFPNGQSAGFRPLTTRRIRNINNNLTSTVILESVRLYNHILKQRRGLFELLHYHNRLTVKKQNLRNMPAQKNNRHRSVIKPDEYKRLSLYSKNIHISKSLVFDLIVINYFSIALRYEREKCILCLGTKTK